MSWSITRIRHPKYPAITVRIGEFEAGGILHAFRWVNGKQSSRSLKCRRNDLGANPKAQEKEARRIACEYIEGLANPLAVVESPGGADATAPSFGGQLLTIRALADRYDLDGFAKSTASYKRDALANGKPIRFSLKQPSRPMHSAVWALRVVE